MTAVSDRRVGQKTRGLHHWLIRHALFKFDLRCRNRGKDASFVPAVFGDREKLGLLAVADLDVNPRELNEASLIHLSQRVLRRTSKLRSAPNPEIPLVAVD